jgi:hypothetical protein
MKHGVTALFLMAAALARPVSAQPGSLCDKCAAASRCEPAREACATECRARYFSIDPKRTNCVAQCSDEATSCNEGVWSFCRAQNRCQ